MSAVASPEVDTPIREKRSKKDKSSKSKSERKRAREEDTAADGERKHKKTKSILADASITKEEPDQSQDTTKKEKKASKSSKKKESRLKVEDDAVQDDVLHSQPTAAAAPSKSEKSITKKKKVKKEEDATQMDEAANPIEHGASKSEKKKNKKREPEPSPPATLKVKEDDGDAMEIDEPAEATSSGIYQPPDMPANPQFPFFKQTVSLYEPIYPNGWAQPVTSAQDHHLQQLQNKYVPSLRGVLLDYANVSLGPEPGRVGAAADDESPTTLLSKGEYAVGFGWITADVGLFVPSRGAWMEGSVNLQTEGHIGVVCFGKFNASIEASRLPPSWKWVSNESPDASGFEETASVITADDHGVVRQIHSTGFWIDGSGTRVRGKVRFRIRNFDAGTSGETSYLSLEGTMLDKASEKKLIQEEARLAQVRRDKKGGRKMERRRAPDFSMTRFAMQEDENQGDDPAVAPAAESNIVKFDE
ncbi:hypothetical protein E4U17_005016 [Claviceps sp. LM77 group G4]|nr:hypothetical protein E4U17_005016 [Claviceps sp. LM77 group G4]KAG6066088.1 hypothetical protein E4U33_005693 [Claviceps sp. LM78 group G4]KAG6071808.1 hypothetical protein E4U16_005862 [Claviceps sp. LM84 group G4]